MINIFTHSNIGRRETNQDRFACFRLASVGPQKSKDVYLVIVADGMGGHSSGDKYAECVIRCISSRIAGIVAQAELQSQRGEESFGDALDAILGRQSDSFLSKVNSDLIEETSQARLDLGGTTASFCLIYGDKAYFMNSGDSPIYLYHEYSKTAEEIGVRDNQAETLVREGTLERGTDSYYADSSMLLSFFGKRSGYTVPSEIESHFTSRELSEGDVILIGSDGAFGADILCEEQLARFLSGVPGVRYFGKELLAKASRTTDDNQTLTVIRYMKEGESGFLPPDEKALPAVSQESEEDVGSAGESSKESRRAARKRWLNLGRK